jgi:DNA-directed RNA polymerase specialized sigma24 family protein
MAVRRLGQHASATDTQEGHRDDWPATVAAACWENRDWMLRVASALLRDRDEAEDACQEVFARLLAAGFNGDNRLRPALLHTAVRNVCYDVLRRERGSGRLQALVAAREEHAGGPGSPVAEDPRLRVVYRMLPDLSTSQRVCFALRASGMTCAVYTCSTRHPPPRGQPDRPYCSA